MPASPNDPILFFDGVCNLCNGAVQFVIRHERQGKIRFATLQSPAGIAALKALQEQTGKQPDSLILKWNERYYTRSDAALQLAGLLDGGWKWLRLLLVVPPFIRNGVYRLIAQNRYRWFGKKESCMVPTSALKAKFID